MNVEPNVLIVALICSVFIAAIIFHAKVGFNANEQTPEGRKRGVTFTSERGKSQISDRGVESSNSRQDGNLERVEAAKQNEPEAQSSNDGTDTHSEKVG